MCKRRKTYQGDQTTAITTITGKKRKCYQKEKPLRARIADVDFLIASARLTKDALYAVIAKLPIFVPLYIAADLRLIGLSMLKRTLQDKLPAMSIADFLKTIKAA